MNLKEPHDCASCFLKINTRDCWIHEGFEGRLQFPIEKKKKKLNETERKLVHKNDFPTKPLAQ